MEYKHAPTDSQLILNTFQGYKTLIIQIKFIEKRDKMLKNREHDVYFLMCICEHEAKSGTEAIFCIPGSLPRNQF